MEICISVPNLIEIGDSRLRYGDKAIFKMAAVRYLEFSKIDILILFFCHFDFDFDFDFGHMNYMSM